MIECAESEMRESRCNRLLLFLKLRYSKSFDFSDKYMLLQVKNLYRKFESKWSKGKNSKGINLSLERQHVYEFLHILENSGIHFIRSNPQFLS